MSKFKVAISDLRFEDTKIESAMLKGNDCDLSVFNCATEEEMIEHCANMDAILLNLAPCSAKVIEKLSKCKVISRYGVGYDNVDVDCCTKRGIAVTNVRDYCSEDVSDMAMALLLACARKVAYKDHMIRSGAWNLNEKNMVRIRGKAVALIGFGSIARAFLRKLRGFEIGKVLVYDPYVDSQSIAALGAEKVDLETALSSADFVSLHLPLNHDTQGIIGRRELAMLKPNAILINTSRGALVCEDAMIEALKENRFSGAGLDTLCQEPPRAGNPLLKMDNCVLTDHSGFNTVEAVEDLRKKATQNVIDVLTGASFRSCVNAPILSHVR